jgi:Flp pilus assembly protein TadD
MEPGHELAHYDMGVTLGGLERWEDAAEAFERATQLRPYWAEAFGNLAWAYAMLGRFDEGIRASQEAIRLKPEHALHHNNRCLMYVASGNRAAALREFETVRILNAEMGKKLARTVRAERPGWV